MSSYTSRGLFLGAEKLRVVQIGGLSIDVEGVVPAPAPPIMSLSHLESVPLPTAPFAVNHWKGDTYIGLSNFIVIKLDSKHQLNEKFLKFPSHVVAIEVYKEKMYILVHGSAMYTVHVYDMAGELVTKWNHTDIGSHAYTGMAIVADQVVIPDRKNYQLVVYSLSGVVKKTIRCLQLSPNTVSVCAVGDDSVVISDYSSAQVFKVEIATGDVSWASDMTNPEGIACYGKQYVLVAAYGTTTMKIFDVDKGLYVS